MVVSTKKQELPYNNKLQRSLGRGSRDLHQQHSRYGQGGPCGDYCGAGSAGDQSVRYFQFQSGRSTWDWNTENYV